MTISATYIGTYGVLGIGQSNVALPVGALREVADLPHQLTPAPMAPAWALGAFMLREEMIPVIDLSRLLQLDDSTGSRHEGDRVAVVQWHSGIFGLRVDAIHAITSVASEDLQSLEDNQAGHDTLIPAAFNLRQADQHRLVYVLDLEALCSLEGVTRSVSSTGKNDPDIVAKASSCNQRHERQRALMIECLGVTLSLPSTMVREIQPLERLAPRCWRLRDSWAQWHCETVTCPYFVH